MEHSDNCRLWFKWETKMNVTWYNMLSELIYCWYRVDLGFAQGLYKPADIAGSRVLRVVYHLIWSLINFISLCSYAYPLHPGFPAAPPLQCHSFVPKIQVYTTNLLKRLYKPFGGAFYYCLTPIRRAYSWATSPKAHSIKVIIHSPFSLRVPRTE